MRKSIESFFKRNHYTVECFVDNAPSVGADPSWWGKEIAVTNEVKNRVVQSIYTVVGIDSDRPKNCIVVVTQRGKFRYTSVETVALCLGGGSGMVAGGSNRRALDLG